MQQDPPQKTKEVAPISGGPPTGKSLAYLCNGLIILRAMWSTEDALRSRGTQSGRNLTKQGALCLLRQAEWINRVENK